MTNLLKIIRSLPSSRITFRSAFLSVTSFPAEPTICNRSFYEDYYNLELVKELGEKAQSQMKNPEAFKKSVTKNFHESGLKNIFLTEIDQYLKLAQSKDEMKEAVNILVALMNNELPFDAEEFQKLLIYFLKKCYSFSAVDEAKQLWSTNLLRFSNNTNSNLMRLYLDILYSHGRYEDVIDEFDKSNFLFNNNVKGLQSLDLVSFSCFKIGTRESLKKNIQEVLPLYQGKFESDRLVLQFTAMHAFKLEEYAVAMMYVQKLKENTRFVHPFHIDLEMMILIKTGKLEEAFTMFRANHMSRMNGQGYILSPIVVELVKELRNHEDGGHLLKEMLTLVGTIDSQNPEQVINCSLEDMLPKKKSPEKKKISRKEKFKKKKMIFSDVK